MTGFAITHRTPRRWLRITLSVPADAGETLAAFLAAYTDTGVELEEMGDVQKVTGYLELPEDEEAAQAVRQETPARLQDLLSAARDHSSSSIPFVLETGDLEEEDWDRAWKQHFTALQVTPRLMITPSWEKTASAMMTLEMDPGQAFGTGHHHSTQLALQLIDELFLTATEPPMRVLDVGTGTGVLAMAAALFGARQVLAIDNDPDAVAAAGDNVSRNNLAAAVRVTDQDIMAVSGSFDLVVANITHDTLVGMAPALSKLLSPGGTLILAGILIGDQEHSCRQTYTAAGLEHGKTMCQDQWAALLFRKG